MDFLGRAYELTSPFDRWSTHLQHTRPSLLETTEKSAWRGPTVRKNAKFMPLSSRDCVIFRGIVTHRQVLHRTIDSHLNNQGLAFIRNDRLVGQTDDVVGYCFFLSHLTGLLVEVHNKSVSLVTPMRSLEKLLYLALVVSVGCGPLEKAQICENGEIVLENGRAISWKTRDGEITVHREIAKSDGLILCATRSEDCLWFSYTPDSTKFSVQSQVGVFYRARAREQKLSIQGRITEIAAVDCNVCYFVVNDPEAEVLSDQLLLCHVEGNSGSSKRGTSTKSM